MNHIRLSIFSALLLLSIPLSVQAQQQSPVSGAFKISVDNITTTQARVLATSTVQPELTGTVFILKSSNGDTADYCQLTFPSAVSVPCLVTGLSPATAYSINVSAVDSSQREYTGTSRFTTAQAAGASSSTAQSSTTSSQTTPNTSTYVPAQNPFTTTSSGANTNVSNFQLQVRLNNPLKVDTIEGAVRFFVTTLVKIAIPFIVVFFIWAGLKFILALGKPEEVAKAKKMFWYTIIGMLLILGAWTITNAIIGTINSITN